jgi:hypothetical protein
LANDHRAYRETLAVALRLLRPATQLVVVEPASLGASILEHAPQVVICSQLTSVIETRTPTWVVLYPDGDAGALLHIRGERTTVRTMDLADVIRLIGQTNQGAQAEAR